MKKFRYLKISKTKKLRYIDNYSKKKLYITFLPGFMSDIEGKKPQRLKRYAIKKGLGFLALEYSGHGKSSGKFFLKDERECLAACCGAPMMQVDHKYYENLTKEKIDKIITEIENG